MDHIDTVRADTASREAGSPGIASTDTATRVRQIRATLPGQVLRERIELAAVSYGPLMTLTQIRLRIGETLPRKFGFVRSAALEPIESYRGPIPDEALLKYGDAHRSGLFSKFWVATPTYYQERQVDPWIVGEVAGSELCAIIAQWS
jgi:hypothetical protein